MSVRIVCNPYMYSDSRIIHRHKLLNGMGAIFIFVNIEVRTVIECQGGPDTCKMRKLPAIRI